MDPRRRAAPAARGLTLQAGEGAGPRGRDLGITWEAFLQPRSPSATTTTSSPRTLPMPNDLRVAKVTPLPATSSSRSLLGAAPGSPSAPRDQHFMLSWVTSQGACVTPHSFCRSGCGTVDCNPLSPWLQGAAKRRVCNESTSMHTHVNAGNLRGTWLTCSQRCRHGMAGAVGKEG